jgi:hypothetical protein
MQSDCVPHILILTMDFTWTTGDQFGIVHCKLIDRGGSGAVHEVMKPAILFNLWQMFDNFQKRVSPRRLTYLRLSQGNS